MFKNPVMIAAFILAALFFLIGFIPAKKWAAWQQDIIVDTPEEFQRKNTP